MRGFAAGYAAAQGAAAAVEAPSVAAASAQVSGPAALMKEWQVLMARIAAMPGPVQDMAKAGLAKVVDFQDCAYGGEYLDHLEGVLARDSAARDWALSAAAAKYIANAMAYDDIIRVADLKTRSTRFHRITGEMNVEEGQLVELTEFFHPRAEEIASLMPRQDGREMGSQPAPHGDARPVVQQGAAVADASVAVLCDVASAGRAEGIPAAHAAARGRAGASEEVVAAKSCTAGAGLCAVCRVVKMQTADQRVFGHPCRGVCPNSPR